MSNEKNEREDIVKEGIGRFLDENDLGLTSQNEERILKHILTIFKGSNSISTSMIHNYLQESFEYNKYNIEYMNDGSSAEFSQDALTSILITADRGKRSVKGWLIAVVVVVVIVTSSLLVALLPSKSKLTTAQADELKSLVSQVVMLSDGEGDKATHQAVWNSVKHYNEVKQYGYQASYREFTRDQYVAAKQYLESLIEDGSL